MSWCEGVSWCKSKLLRVSKNVSEQECEWFGFGMIEHDSDPV